MVKDKEKCFLQYYPSYHPSGCDYEEIKKCKEKCKDKCKDKCKCKGKEGPRGKKGCQGPQGPQGPPGPDGIKGMTGNRGSTGPQGPTGPIGPDGMTGAPGPTGTIVILKGCTDAESLGQTALNIPDNSFVAFKIINSCFSLWGNVRGEVDFLGNTGLYVPFRIPLEILDNIPEGSEINYSCSSGLWNACVEINTMGPGGPLGPIGPISPINQLQSGKVIFAEVDDVPTFIMCHCNPISGFTGGIDYNFMANGSFVTPTSVCVKIAQLGTINPPVPAIIFIEGKKHIAPVPTRASQECVLRFEVNPDEGTARFIAGPGILFDPPALGQSNTNYCIFNDSGKEGIFTIKQRRPTTDLSNPVFLNLKDGDTVSFNSGDLTPARPEGSVPIILNGCDPCDWEFKL